MKFMKNEMKAVLAVAKRVVKDKNLGRIALQSTGNMRIHIKCSSADGTLHTYHTITSMDDDLYAFEINPLSLDKYTKTKGGDEEIEFKVNTKSITKVGTKDNFKIFPIEEDLMYHRDDLEVAAHGDGFIEVLKGSDLALKNNKDINSNYLKITSEKALAAEETQIHLFRVGMGLPFNGGYLHKESVSVLAKSLKGELKFGMDNNYLVIFNKNIYYLVKVETKVPFPTFRNMVPLTRDVMFHVNVDEVMECLKNYTKKEVSQVVFTHQGNELTIDPRNPEQLSFHVDIEVTEGSFKQAIFLLDQIKSFFSGYSGLVQVEQQQFRNVYGTIGYLWRIYTTDKTTMISGIEEPDWEKIEAHFREGRIGELTVKK